MLLSLHIKILIILVLVTFCSPKFFPLNIILNEIRNYEKGGCLSHVKKEIYIIQLKERIQQLENGKGGVR